MKLKKELGLFSSVSVLAGIMIGSGIYFFSMLVLGLASNSLGLSLVAWLVGGIITLFSALTYAELGTLFPKTGGYYVYLRKAYGRRIAFLSGITNFFLSSSGSVALLALLFAQVIGFMTGASHIVDGITKGGFDPLIVAAIAAIVILILSLINYLGIQYGKVVQNIFFVAKLIPLFTIIIYGLFFGTQTNIFASNGAENINSGLLVSGLLFAVARTLFAYEGWTNLNTVAEEMKDTKRDLPKALTIAVALVMGVYVLFVVGLYRIISPATLANLGTGAVEAGFDLGAVYSAFGAIFTGFDINLLGYVVFGAIAISIFGSLNGSILSFPRVYLAMAEDETLPKVFGKVDAKFQTPWVAIVGQTIVSLIIVLLGYDNVNFLLSIILFGALVFNTLIFLSVFKFRKTMPKAERPYKVWGFPYVPSLAIVGMIILLIVTMIRSPEASMLSIFIILAGNGFYEVFMDKDRLPLSTSDTPAPVTLETTNVVAKKVSTKKVTKRKSKKV
jgi:APA family basic amino acid/polyamine antiporter